MRRQRDVASGPTMKTGISEWPRGIMLSPKQRCCSLCRNEYEMYRSHGPLKQPRLKPDLAELWSFALRTLARYFGPSERLR
jgi:hypothetical protein